MELEYNEVIINMDCVKAGFLDIVKEIELDDQIKIGAREAMIVLFMALKTIESVGVK